MKEYNTFEELYIHYKHLIDAEFEERHLERMRAVIESFSNLSEWESRYIATGNTEENDYSRYKISVLENVKRAIEKEMTLRLPRLSYTNRKIREIQDALKDVFDEILQRKDRGYNRSELEYRSRLAVKCIDIVTQAIQDTYATTNYHSNIPNKEALKLVDEKYDKLIVEQQEKHYHDLCQILGVALQYMKEQKQKKAVD